MFHAEIRPAKVFTRIIDSVKEVVNEITFECSQSQVMVRAMDSGHVSLVSLQMTADQFHSYRCEKNMALGVNLGSLSKVLKCSSGDDCVTLRSSSDSDLLDVRLADANEERVSDFSMKLLEIDSEQLDIPPQNYSASVTLPSSEFAKICRDTSNFGDTVTVSISENSVAFSASGDIGTGKVILKASKSLDAHTGVPIKKEKVEQTEEPPTKKVKKEKKVNDEEEDGKKKVIKREREGVRVKCDKEVTLQFALRYLTMFSKAQAVSEYVTLKVAQDVPLQVEFDIDVHAPVKGSDQDQDVRHKLGYLRYFLAPKVGDEADEEEHE